LTLFQILGQKFVKFFVGILVQKVTPKGHFEINWPLGLSWNKEMHLLKYNFLSYQLDSYPDSPFYLPLHKGNWVLLNCKTLLHEFLYSSGGEQKVAFDIPWNVGQPDGLDAQNCIIFGYSQDERWNDMECTDKFRYICEF
jgi:hypothetical protein